MSLVAPAGRGRRVRRPRAGGDAAVLQPPRRDDAGEDSRPARPARCCTAWATSGYIDDRGRLWFCGRKSHRVVTPHGTLFTDMVEPIFNTVPGVVTHSPGRRDAERRDVPGAVRRVAEVGTREEVDSAVRTAEPPSS